MTVCILSLIYEEPEWVQTKECIERLGVSCFYVDRQGVGSMAKAYNDGFRENQCAQFDYVWFLSNVTFPKDCLEKLLAQMERGEFAAIHPSFHSDHAHTRPLLQDVLLEAPFLEFTAPLVRSSVYAQLLLDEEMPYWGHDIDWGHRVRELGQKLGVHHGTVVDHCYIRFASKHPVREARAQLRRDTDAATRAALVRKYGPDWKGVLKL